MSPKKQQIPHRLDDPDFRNAEVALRRAAEKAQERAKQAGSEPIIIEHRKDKARKPVQDRKSK